MKTIRPFHAVVAFVAMCPLAFAALQENADGSAVSIAENESPPLRVGLYVDNGSRSNGWAAWLRLLHSSPQITPVLLDGRRIRGGALEGVDVLVMPGGASSKQGQSLGAAGRAAVTNWLASGGRYFGTCAGCSLLLNRPDSPLLRILPYVRDAATPKGGSDMLMVEVSKRGEEVTGIHSGIHPMRYHSGPVLVPTDPVPGTEVEVFARWHTDFRTRAGASTQMAGSPALLCGTHGKGKFFVTTGHPEHFPRTRDFIAGGFRYLAGVETTFSPPTRTRGALCVGFYTPCVSGIEAAETFLALDRDSAFDITPIQNDDITAGALDRLDALVLPCGDAKEYPKRLPPLRSYLNDFAARGGAIVAWGEGADALDELAPAPPSATKASNADAAVLALRAVVDGKRD